MHLVETTQVKKYTLTLKLVKCTLEHYSKQLAFSMHFVMVQCVYVSETCIMGQSTSVIKFFHWCNGHEICNNGEDEVGCGIYSL